MTRKIKLSSSLPDGDANGLDAIARSLAERPDRPRAVIALVDNKATATDNDTGDITITLRVRRIESVRNIDLRTVEEMLRRSIAARTGAEQLPLEFEDDISALFSGSGLLLDNEEDRS